MKTISLAIAAISLVSTNAFADGLYLRPDGYWRAMPPPTYCCSCEFNPTPCGYGRGPPPVYDYGPPPPPVSYYGPPPIDPGLAIAGAILSVAPIIAGAISRPRYGYGRRW
jgi:hypothetical protein